MELIPQNWEYFGCRSVNIISFENKAKANTGTLDEPLRFAAKASHLHLIFRYRLLL